eukprot:NODE_373_length_9849_cov_0.356205.p1 type:complete len:819 gc:universal NODE_373_length_9849_cov_0.356205:5458-3002(-)
MQQVEENELVEELYYEFQDELIKSQLELEQKRLEKVEKQLLILNDDEKLQQEYNTILSRMSELQNQMNTPDENDLDLSASPPSLAIEPQSDDVSIFDDPITTVISDDSNNDAFYNRTRDLPVKESFSSFEIPNLIKSKLYNYQIDGIYWMANLYKQGKGALLADEMGLGKSIQAVGFLAGLESCKILNDALIVTPGTLLNQWMQVFHHWYPFFRVIVFHGSMTSDLKSVSKILNKRQNSVIVITTYESVRLNKYFLRSWDCVILDEGHKIRTPNTLITAACKSIKSPYRYILSGTPIQNNLKELWCLMDFVYPGLLGTLDIFNDQFILPINLGGYATSTSVEVNAAYSCTLSLKKLINPHFLRRLKSNVAKQLPKKSEFVLLCELTDLQYNQYCHYLDSEETSKIFKGKMNVLVGIDILRKISNHPDLLHEQSRKAANSTSSIEELVQKSGKCKVLQELLQKWHIAQDSNKVLIFCQTRQMLDVLENMVKLIDYKYLRMDGTTNIKYRSEIVNEFNNNKEVFIFLLTTKTGGLGLNLTGANKVIIFDCDFNPSNDEQSRERTWRLGQKRPVEIYRLISAKTIEEKIYHRQIFKKFMANKILDDPNHKRLFKFQDLRDLFQKPDAAAISTTRREINQITKNSKPGDKATKDRVMDLLQNTSIKAFSHDRIMNSGQDNTLLQKEADRIAKNALAALRESRNIRRAEMRGVLEPMLQKRRFDINNSSALLANLRVKHQIDTGSHIPVRSPALLTPQHKESMIVDIQEYLKVNKPTSKEIINHFCKEMADSDKAVFGKMLKGIANLKNTEKGKIWILKSDFQ